MWSVILFISGGEIFVILIAILIFFGADKIPDFARMMGKGVREFRKASDDLKREFSESTSGITQDIKAIQEDLTETFTKEISEPMQETVSETSQTFEEYQKDYDNEYNVDYYYNNPDYTGSRGNEYQAELQESSGENTEPAPPDSREETATNDGGEPKDTVRESPPDEEDIKQG